jgi:hypothetical protein
VIERVEEFPHVDLKHPPTAHVHQLVPELVKRLMR